MEQDKFKGGISREDAIDRIDRWFGDRYNRYYTEQHGNEIISRLEKKLEAAGILTEETRPHLNFECFSAEFQRENAHHYFSTGEQYLAALTDSKSDFRRAMSQYSKGVQEEYVEPVIEKLKSAYSLIDDVIEFGKSKKSSDITDEEINKLFLLRYKGVPGFSALGESIFDAMLLLTYPSVLAKQIGRKDYESMKNLYGILKTEISASNNVIFQDLI